MFLLYSGLARSGSLRIILLAIRGTLSAILTQRFSLIPRPHTQGAHGISHMTKGNFHTLNLHIMGGSGLCCRTAIFNV